MGHRQGGDERIWRRCKGDFQLPQEGGRMYVPAPMLWRTEVHSQGGQLGKNTQCFNLKGTEVPLCLCKLPCSPWQDSAVPLNMSTCPVGGGSPLTMGGAAPCQLGSSVFPLQHSMFFMATLTYVWYLTPPPNLGDMSTHRSNCFFGCHLAPNKLRDLVSGSFGLSSGAEINLGCYAPK